MGPHYQTGEMVADFGAVGWSKCPFAPITWRGADKEG